MEVVLERRTGEQEARGGADTANRLRDEGAVVLDPLSLVEHHVPEVEPVGEHALLGGEHLVGGDEHVEGTLHEHLLLKPVALSLGAVKRNRP